MSEDLGRHKHPVPFRYLYQVGFPTEERTVDSYQCIEVSAASEKCSSKWMSYGWLVIWWRMSAIHFVVVPSDTSQASGLFIRVDNLLGLCSTAKESCHQLDVSVGHVSRGKPLERHKRAEVFPVFSTSCR